MFLIITILWFCVSTNALKFNWQACVQLDEIDLSLKSGLLVDYSFNDTLNEGDDQNKLISVPGCPQSGENLSGLHNFTRSFWVQHPSYEFEGTNRCFLVGTSGPCDKETKLEAQRNSILGVCVCSCFFYPQRTIPFRDSKQIICHDKSLDKYMIMINGTCYEEETQGPCDPDKVVIIDTNSNSFTCNSIDKSVKLTKNRGRPMQTVTEFTAESSISSTWIQPVELETEKTNFKFSYNRRTRKTTSNPDLPLIPCRVNLDRPVPTRHMPNLYPYYIQRNSPELYCASYDQKYSKILNSCVPMLRGKSRLANVG